MHAVDAQQASHDSLRIQRNLAHGGDRASEDVAPSHPELLEPIGDCALGSTELSHKVEPAARRRRVDRLGDLVSVSAGIDAHVRAKALCELEAMLVEIADEYRPSPAGSRQRAGAEAEHTGALDPHVLTSASAGPAKHRDRGRSSAVRRTRDKVGQLVGNPQDRRACHQMAVLRKAATQRMLAELLVAVLEQPLALLRQLALAVEAPAAARRDRPSHTIPDLELSTVAVVWRAAGTEGFDPAEDLVSEDRRRRRDAATRVGFEVAAADRAQESEDQELSLCELGDCELADCERATRPCEDRCPRDREHQGRSPRATRSWISSMQGVRSAMPSTT